MISKKKVYKIGNYGELLEVIKMQEKECIEKAKRECKKTFDKRCPKGILQSNSHDGSGRKVGDFCRDDARFELDLI